MATKRNKLEALLQKYYEGETTLAEEKELAEILNATNDFLLFKPEQHWFRHLQEARSADVKADFEQRAQEKIRAQAAATPSERIPNRRIAWIIKVAAALVLGMGMRFLYQIYFSRADAWIEQSTSSINRTAFTLPDGSKVWLNAASRFRHPKQFDSATREVWLEGEAYFEVVKHARKPFRVRTGQTITEVLGTSFNVRGYPKEPTVEVVVVSGKVAFASQKAGGAEKIWLLPGNEGIFHDESQSVRKIAQSNPNKLAWKTRTLVFNDTPLRDMIPVLENYFHVGIEADTTLLNCRFKGTFREASLEDVLRVVAYSMDITSRKKDQHYLLAGKGCP